MRLYRAGLRYLSNGKPVKRWLCRDCGYRFSESSVEVNVVGKVGESPDSGENHHKVGVASGDTPYEKVDDGLSLFYGEDVSSHKLSIVEKGLNGLPFYNSKHQVCAQKDAKNLNPTTEIKTFAGEEKLTTKGKMLQFALHCRNEGLAEETVRIWYNRLKRISEKAELNEPESVKEYIAKAVFAQGTKYNRVVVYNAYL